MEKVKVIRIKRSITAKLEHWVKSSSWTLNLQVCRHGEEKKTITQVSKFLLRCIGSLIRREGERSFKQGEVFAYSAGVLGWK